MKAQAYATGQFGKNHLGDKDEFLPTNHGFDEFFGIAFKLQKHTGLDVWKRDFVTLRAPDVYNLRSDPFERGPESFEYGKWVVDRSYLLVPAQAVVGKWLSSFKELPIRQKPASFNLDEVMRKLDPPQTH